MGEPWGAEIADVDIVVSPPFDPWKDYV